MRSVLRFALLVILLASFGIALQQPSWRSLSETGALLETIKYEFNAAKAATDPTQKANHNFLLNDAAERLAIKLNESVGGVSNQGEALERTKAQVEEANKFGAKLFWCEMDARWASRPDGYLQYLELDPSGAYAEESWWRGKLLRDLIPCVDMEGTPEEARYWLSQYSEFVRRFPKGKHLREAREQVKYWTRQVRAYGASSRGK